MKKKLDKRQNREQKTLALYSNCVCVCNCAGCGSSSSTDYVNVKNNIAINLSFSTRFI